MAARNTPSLISSTFAAGGTLQRPMPAYPFKTIGYTFLSTTNRCSERRRGVDHRARSKRQAGSQGAAWVFS